MNKKKKLRGVKVGNGWRVIEEGDKGLGVFVVFG